MTGVFFSYSHPDETLRNELEKHLSQLKREGAITTWHDRRLIAGEPVDTSISKWLEGADVILLLVSSDFLSSEYCYSKEMKRAMERHQAGEARVIPVILRSCDWHSAPFGRLLALPTDGKPVTKWTDRDDAFLDIAKGVRAAVVAQAKRPTTVAPRSVAPSNRDGDAPRSSNLRMRQAFTDRDRDVFLDESFEYIARYFENSLAELQSRNPGIETSFKRIDATRFGATVYRSGAALARCTIRNGGSSRVAFGGITLSYGTHHTDNSINESLSVVVGEQALSLASLGMAMHQRDRDTKLSQEGAAEYYWSIFIEPLQN